MKRLYIFLLMFLLLGTVTFADVTTDDLDANQVIYLSGSAELSWGIAGQIIDNSGAFLGEIPNKALFADTDSDVNWPFSWTLSLEAADEDGMVMVAAEAEIDLEDAGLTLQEGEGVSFEFIEFPNVVPGMVMIRLLPDDVVGTDVTASDSESSAPTVEIVATPIDGLEAKLAIAFANGQYNSMYWSTDSGGTGVDFSGMNPVTSTLDDLYDALDDAASTGDGDTDDWVLGNYSSFGVALQVEYVLAIGEEDSVTVTAGTVFDTAYTNHVYPGSLKQSEILGEDLAGLAPGDRWYVEETWGAKTAKNWDILADDFDPMDMIDDILDGSVWGYATMPIGLQVDLDMMGIEASVAFQARLVQGWDILNPSKGKYDMDVEDVDGNPLDEFNPASYDDPADYEMGVPQAYAMPMYISVDAAYEMEMAGMTISPSADFQFCSDFYKISGEAGDEIEYVGDVTSAQFLGRMMSASLGVDVEGIAEMIDVSLSGAIGLGFGSEPRDWPFDSAYNAVMWPADILNIVDDMNYDSTEDEKAAADADAEPDSWNNMIFIDDFGVFSVTIGVEAAPIANLTLSNDFTYTHDGMGIEGANDVEIADLVAEGVWLDMMENATSVEYEIQVAMATAATLYADLTYTSYNYSIEQGTYFEGWNTDDTDLDYQDIRIWDSEAGSMATFDYEVGVKVTVDL